MIIGFGCQGVNPLITIFTLPSLYASLRLENERFCITSRIESSGKTLQAVFTLVSRFGTNYGETDHAQIQIPESTNSTILLGLADKDYFTDFRS